MTIADIPRNEFRSWSSGWAAVRSALLHGLYDYSIAVCLALAGIGLLYAGQAIPFRQVQISSLNSLVSTKLGGMPIAGLWWTAAALLMWGLAEVLTRRRKLSAPNIVLAVLFASFAGLAIFTWLTFAGFFAQAAPFTASGTLLAFIAHYYRFRLPFTVVPVAVGGWLFAVGAVTIAIGFLNGLPPGHDGSVVPVVTVIYGCAMFVIALRLDRAEQDRSQQKSEAGFWLHALAAPMITLPIVGPLTDQLMVTPDATHLLAAVLATTIVFAVISLLADRMAPIMCVMAYPILVLALAHARAPDGNMTQLLAAGVPLEGLALALCFTWRPLRRALLELLPGPWANWFAVPISGIK